MPILPGNSPGPEPIPLSPSPPVVVPPRPIHQTVPDLSGLPARLLPSRVQLFVKVEVSSTGHVTDAQIVGDPKVALAVSGAAVNAAKQWVFQPATVRGTNAASVHIIRFDFGARS
jgi:TonB family protein